MTTGSTDTASAPTAAGSAPLASPRRESPVGLVVYALTLLVLVASGAAPSPRSCGACGSATTPTRRWRSARPTVRRPPA